MQDPLVPDLNSLSCNFMVENACYNFRVTLFSLVSFVDIFFDGFIVYLKGSKKIRLYMHSSFISLFNLLAIFSLISVVW